MSGLKEPAAKLPLAVRKNVRDSYENKRPELEAELSGLLGAPWTFEINPLAIFPYAEERSYGYDSLGDCIAAYVEGAIWRIKYFTEKHGADGKTELNSVAPTHIVTLGASTQWTYNGCKIEEGKLNLYFNPNCLGTNIDNAAEKIADAISAAPQPEGASTLSYAARHAVKSDYDPKIGALLERAQKQLQNPAFKFEPDFTGLGQALKGGKDVRDDWEGNLGDFAYKYYESFVETLEREKFGDDDMLREGFEEGVPKGEIKLRVIEKISGYSDMVIDDGALVLRTSPENWGTNISQSTYKLLELL